MENIFETISPDETTLLDNLEKTRAFSKITTPNKDTSILDLDQRFAIKDTIGEGAFGVVELLEDNHIGRNVARKSFKHTDEMAFLEYEKEVQIVGQLDHPGVPMIYDVGVDKEHPYLLMKYIQGKTLKEIITELARGKEETHAKFRFPQRAQIIKELLRVLIASHEKGIVHRDIKPANIMVSDNGEVYLMDWGIAINTNIYDVEPTICGTPLYMAPEQASGKKIAPYTDTYSLGMVFYHLMTLFPPRKVDTLPNMLQNILTEVPPQSDIRYHPSQGYNPSEYRIILKKATSLDPQERYQSAKEMLQDIEDVQNGNICSVCPRTFIKGTLHKYFSFLDQRAYFAVSMTIILLLLSVGVLLGIGYVLGSS